MYCQPSKHRYHGIQSSIANDHHRPLDTTMTPGPHTTVAVIGAGPAGARCAELLAAAGCETVLFDHRAPWEKPCGGMLRSTMEADFPFYSHYPFRTRRYTSMLHLSSRRESYLSDTGNSFDVLSRRDLGDFMLRRAGEAGARFINEQVRALERTGDIWTVTTEHGIHTAALLVGADGYPSMVRRVLSAPMEKRDLYLCCGYFAEGVGEDRCIAKFTDIEGYLWVVANRSHYSAGILARMDRIHGRDLYARLDDYLAAHYPGTVKLKKWSALLPSASSPGFFDLPACGDAWLLAGDAAGHVDPITGEGIYYALRGGELAARAILSGDIGGYDALWREAYGGELKEKAVHVANLVSISRGMGPEVYGAFLYRYFTGGINR